MMLQGEVYRLLDGQRLLLLRHEISIPGYDVAKRGPELARTLVSVVWRNDSWFVKAP